MADRNPFDQFDEASGIESTGNPFDQFDAAPNIEATGTPFDQFEQTPVENGYADRGTMQAVERSTLESVTDPFVRGWQRARQGVSVGLNEMGLTGQDEGGDIRHAVRMADLNRQTEAYGRPLEMEDALQGIVDAESLGSAISQVVTNPGVVLDVVAESMAMMAPQLGATGIASMAGPAGTASAAGFGSAAMEYTQSIVSTIAEHGGNPSDPADWLRMMDDEALMSEAREKAATRGVIIGAFDAVTAGIAGRLMAGAKPTALSTVSRATGEAGIQAAGGAGGEAAAGLATDDFSIGETVLEGIAEIPTAIVEVPGNVRHAYRQGELEQPPENEPLREVPVTEEVTVTDQTQAPEQSLMPEPGADAIYVDPEDAPTPESEETLDAQVEAFEDGRKPAILVTPGEEVATPEGAKTATVPGHGTLIYRTDDQLEEALDGRLGSVLGYGIDEKPDEPIGVVTARDENGTVIQDVATDGSPEVESAALDVAGPEGSVEIRSAQEAILERHPSLRKQAGFGEELPELETSSSELETSNVPGYLQREPGEQVAPVNGEQVQPAPVEEPEPKYGYEDPRWKRKEYSENITRYVRNNTEEGGGITLVPKEGATPTSQTGDILYDYGTENVRRTPSVNPQWVQNILANDGKDYRLSVDYLRNVAEKAEAGKKLTEQQSRVLSAILDSIQEEREKGVYEAQQRRLDATNARRRARGQAKMVTFEEFQQIDRPEAYGDTGAPGEILEEAEYEPDWDGEARSLRELQALADEIDEQRVEDILTRAETDEDAAAQLWAMLTEEPDGQAEAAAEPQTTDTQEAGRGQGEGTQAETPQPEALELEQQTPEDIEAQNQAEKAKAEAEKAQARKDKADDERDTFTLTGSTREADTAMAAGQQDLLAQTPPEKPAETVPEAETQDFELFIQNTKGMHWDDFLLLQFKDPDQYLALIQEWESLDGGRPNDTVEESETDYQYRHDTLFQDPKNTVKADLELKDQPFIPQREADAIVESWKAFARNMGKKGNGNYQKIIISLFDTSGIWSQPWEDAGYTVHRVDLKDGEDINDFSIEYFERHGYDELEGMGEIYGILAACPCTDFASSGARWWDAKDKDGRTKASVELVSQTKATIEYFNPRVWAIENPVGRIKKAAWLPSPRLWFQPNNYGDTHTKRTQLFGTFNPALPTANIEPVEGSKIVKLSSSAKAERELTPEGFAYAFFVAQHEYLADQIPEPKPIIDIPEAPTVDQARLEAVEIEEEMIVEETGERVILKEKASKLWADAMARRNQIVDLIGCMNS